MVKVTLHIKSFEDQYPSSVRVEQVRFVLSDRQGAHDYSYMSPTKSYIPYTESDGRVGSTYTVLLPPDHTSDYRQQHLSVKPEGYPAVEADLAAFFESAESGKHYHLRVVVGKDRLELGEVTVSDWNSTQELTGGEAKRVPIIEHDEQAQQVTLNLDEAADFDEVKTELTRVLALPGVVADLAAYRFVVKGDARNFFKEGHTLFHATDIYHLDLSDLTGITSIADNQFVPHQGGGDNLPELRVFYAPKHLTSIGKFAFYFHPKLERIYLFDVNEIKAQAFKDCRALQEVTSEGEMNILGVEAFEGCQELRRVDLSVVEVQDKAFANCRELLDVSLRKLKILRDRAFYDCGRLNTVNLFTELEYMGRTVFSADRTPQIRLLVVPGQKALVWNAERNGNVLSNDAIETGNNKPFGFLEADQPLIWSRISRPSTP